MSDIDVEQLNKRLTAIENRLAGLEQGKPNAYQPGTAAPYVPSAAYSTQPVKAPKTSHTEIEIGQKWLSIAGVILLFLGILFLVSYAFQYMDAGSKIAVSYALAIGLGAISFFSHKKYAFFSGIVAAGAWGVAYLTTYAMYFFPTTRIITSSWLEMFLLLAVVLGLMIMSLYQHSRPFVALGAILGFLTMIISPLSLFSILGTVFITAILVAIAMTMPWGDVLFMAAAGSSISYFVWFYDVAGKLPVQGGGLSEKNTIGLIVLLLLWGMISSGLLWRKDKTVSLSGHIDVITMMIASFSTTVLGVATLQPLVPLSERPATAVLLLVLAGLHFAWLLIALSQKKYSELNMIVGVTGLILVMGSAAYAFAADSSWVSVVWVCLGLLIAAGGLVWNKHSVAVTAVLPLVASGLRFMIVDLNEGTLLPNGVPLDMLIGGLVSIGLIGSIALLRSAPEMRNNKEGARHIASVTLVVLLLVLFTLTNKELTGAVPSVMWGIFGLAVVVNGFFSRWKDARVIGLFALALTILRVFINDLSGLEVVPRIISFMALGAMLLLLGYGYNHNKETLEKFLQEEKEAQT